MYDDDYYEIRRALQDHHDYNRDRGSNDDIIEFYVMLFFGIGIVAALIWWGTGWLDDTFGWAIHEAIKDWFLSVKGNIGGRG